MDQHQKLSRKHKRTDYKFASTIFVYCSRIVNLRNGGNFRERDYIRETKHTDVSLFYFNFTCDGYCQLFPLKNDLNYYWWELKKLPNSDFDRTLVWKIVSLLPQSYVLVQI